MATVSVGGREFAFAERALYLPKLDAAVVADLHVGRDAASPVTLPLGERTALCDRLGDALARFAPDTVVFAGDLLHRFDRVTESAAETVRGLLCACRDAGATPVVVAGNHDVHLDAAVDAPVHDARRLADGTVVCHGHEAPEIAAPRYVVGHDHPALAVEGRRHPALLYGPGAHRGGDLFVVPAFTPLAPGVEVGAARASDFQSPLVSAPETLRPVIHDPAADETLAFPPLGRLRDHL